MKIGENFPNELNKADLQGLPIVWTDSGIISGRESLTAAQDAALQGVLDAHDPDAALMPDLTAAQWNHLLDASNSRAVVEAVINAAYVAAQASGDFYDRLAWSALKNTMLNASTYKWADFHTVIEDCRKAGSIESIPSDAELRWWWEQAAEFKGL